ncbi:hypothetical protein ACHAXR_010900 [Thalassiosira sp. AJA248-18]
MPGAGNSSSGLGSSSSTASESNPMAAPTMSSISNDDDNAKQKMFFTTSDLIDRMNSAMKDANADMPVPLPESGGGGGGFELQRKMPDGSYRRAEESEMAAADFQAKMKQASEMIAGLDSQQKIDWAKLQRSQGNKLFAEGKLFQCTANISYLKEIYASTFRFPFFFNMNLVGNYKEAMDVYLTCLVAMDQTTSSVIDEGGESEELINMQIEKEIKLPVLLNLALSALKMGMLSKAEQFCNFAMEMESGKQSVKANFRRGRVRMLMGHYVSAELDLDKALELNGKMSNGENCDFQQLENERAVILREKQKLSRLVNQADKNRKQQKNAMEKLFKSQESENSTERDENTKYSSSLYPEKKGPPTQPPQQLPTDPNPDSLEADHPTCFQWYMRMIGRCAQKLLDIIGDEEDDVLLDVPVDRELLKKLMEEKKKHQ